MDIASKTDHHTDQTQSLKRGHTATHLIQSSYMRFPGYLHVHWSVHNLEEFSYMCVALYNHKDRHDSITWWLIQFTLMWSHPHFLLPNL